MNTQLQRQQMIFALSNYGNAEADRINNRLQQCNVRIVRIDGSTEPSTEIRTRHQLAHTLKNDETIDRVECYFNGKWITAE